MSILPPNSTLTELALDETTARIGAVPVPNADLWNPATCPTAFLPWLAYALSVDDWDAGWDEAVKREVIEQSVAVHRHKGTRGSVVRALAAMGYGTAIVTEAKDLPRLGFGAPLGKGKVLGRTWLLGWNNISWADYFVDVVEEITQVAANALVSRLRSVAPARCRLRRIEFAGIKYVLGSGVWSLGNAVPLGGIYTYEVT